MSIVIPSDIVKSVLRQTTVETYQAATVPDAWIQLLQRERYFHLFVPVVYGGHEASIAEGLEVIYNVSQLNGALGWVLNLGAGAAFFSRSFDPTTAAEIFDHPSTILAGSGAVGGQARYINGKYIIAGQWGKCSGAAHATHFTFNASLKDGTSHAFIIPREEVQLVDDWPIFGLKPTSSNGISIDKKIISERFKFDIEQVKNHPHYTTFQLSFMTFARLCMSASYLGIISCYLRQLTASYDQTNRELPASALLLEQHLQRGTQQLFSIAEVYGIDPSGKTSDAVEALYQGLPKFHRSLSVQVHQTFLDAGLAVTQENQLLHWAWRDAMTAGQHYLI